MVCLINPNRRIKILEKVSLSKKIKLDQHNADDELILMREIALGNTDAFQTVLGLYAIPVFHFSYSILRDVHTAEDITQETHTKLWNHAKNWKQEGTIRSWLFRIAHNLCIDEIRRRKPHVDIDTFADSIADTAIDVTRKIEESQISKTIKSALFKIPIRQRTALMLVHYSDCSNREAANAMNISVDALESLLARGRKSLRELLSNHKDKLWEG
jgi:RNA polymerase sigma-70 factor (ECF subfamily)